MEVSFVTQSYNSPFIQRGIDAVNFWNLHAEDTFDKLKKGKIKEEIPGEKRLALPEYILYKIYQELEIITKVYNLDKAEEVMMLEVEEKEVLLNINNETLLRIYYEI